MSPSLTLAPRFDPDGLLGFLRAEGLDFELVEHPPVFTCEEAEVHLAHLDALGTKNLFLREEKGSRIFLVTVPDTKRVDLGKLRVVLGSSRLTFGNPELLQECLGVEPGSVTVFGIANDMQRKVELFIDTAVLAAARIQAHPLRNTASLLLSPEMLRSFLGRIERDAEVIDVPAK